MTLARRLVAVAAALLQLTLPLAAYAHVPALAGPGDFCSATHRAPSDAPRLPAGHAHTTHCALCAHGTPPALPLAAMPQPLSCGAALRVASSDILATPSPRHARANSRAPPGASANLAT